MSFLLNIHIWQLYLWNHINIFRLIPVLYGDGYDNDHRTTERSLLIKRKVHADISQQTRAMGPVSVHVARRDPYLFIFI